MASPSDEEPALSDDELSLLIQQQLESLQLSLREFAAERAQKFDQLEKQLSELKAQVSLLQAQFSTFQENAGSIRRLYWN